MESSLHLPTELSNTGTQGVLFPSVHHRLVPPPTSGLPCLSVRRLPRIPEHGLVHPRDSQDVEATIKEEAAHCFEFTRRLRNSQRYAQACLIPRLLLINRLCIDCGKEAGRRHDLALYNIGGAVHVQGPPKSVVCAPDNEILFNEIDIRADKCPTISLAQSKAVPLSTRLHHQ